ncbi:MAG: tetratricopeptide repeat protein [Deltaproteobacteria bacterium]|nr:tetratricopeptide repeat protein [Deltaproteobacteria bacterium]
MIFRIAEMPGYAHQEIYHPKKRIDRSSRTVEDFFRDENIEWSDDFENADIWIRKTELSKNNSTCLSDEKSRIENTKSRPTLLLIPEPREFAPATYSLADPKTTMAVAPGSEFKMLYDRGEWVDPQLENWKKRMDRACFIGRPTKDRIEFVKKLISMGVEIDVFSQEVWPLSCWKGAAQDDVETARPYKYRFVYETTHTHLCHSEKLFLGIRSGCVTFYLADPNLKLDFVKNAFLHCTEEAWKNRNEFADGVLEGIQKFMFSDAWEIYSYREYYRRIISEAKRIREEFSHAPKKNETRVEAYRSYSTPKWKTQLEDGLKHIRNKDYSKALPYFQSVKKAIGTIPPVLNNLGIVYMELGQFDEAEKELKLALTRDPEHIEVLMNLGILYVRTRRVSESIKTFEEILKIDPSSKAAIQSLARSYASSQRVDDAISLLQRSLNLHHLGIDLHLDLAQIYFLLGRKEDSKKVLNDASLKDPQNPLLPSFFAQLEVI